LALDSASRHRKPGHHIYICEDGKLVKDIAHFSVGMKGHLTPIHEDVKILKDKRYRMHKSGTWPKPHGGAPMPFSLFFTEDAAFHGGSVHVESHGCIHLGEKDARWLFEWVGKTEVRVHFIGPYSHKHSSKEARPHWGFA